MDISQKTKGFEFQMVQTPNIYCLVSGAAEGNTRLNAFDNALLEAGVGDTNLIRMSSICPPACVEVQRNELVLPKGGLIPIAYAQIDSSTPGQKIASAVAIGIPEDPTEPGVIMEYEDHTGLDYVEKVVHGMVKDAFAYRNRKLKEVKFAGIEHEVNNIGATFAAVVLWYK